MTGRENKGKDTLPINPKSMVGVLPINVAKSPVIRDGKTSPTYAFAQLQ